MSSPAITENGTANFWNPDTVANVTYRAVMVLVGLGMLWKTYRHPTRIVNEEEIIGIVLRAPTNTYKAGKTPTPTTTPPTTTPSSIDTPLRTACSDLASSILDAAVQSAIGIDGTTLPSGTGRYPAVKSV